MIAGLVLTALVAPPSTAQFHTSEVGIALIDFVIFGAFAALSLRANREWPLWMSSMQGVAVLCHLPILFSPEVIPEAYVAMQGVWSWLMVTTAIYGTIRHRRQLLQSGTDPSWRSSSRH